MKTTVEIDDELLKNVMMLSDAKTINEVIAQTLDDLVYRLALKKLDAARGPDLWQGDLEEMRTNSYGTKE